jgi:hypothetical protein
MKERFLDVIKWGLILVIAGGVYLGVQNRINRYFIVGAGQGAAYKIDKMTGRVSFVAGKKEISVTK